MAILLRNLKQLWVIDINVSRDREGSFDPKIIPKRSKDVSGIEDIYGFEISHDTISTITDRVIDIANKWQNRPLKN